MDSPKPLPDWRLFLDRLSARQVDDLLEQGRAMVDSGDYPGWAELSALPAPAGYTVEEWWAALKLVRASGLQATGLTGVGGEPVGVARATGLEGLFHELDCGVGAGGEAGRDRRVARAQRREAVASAALAGFAVSAATEAALRSSRPAGGEGGRAAAGVWAALERTRELAAGALTPAAVRELHGLLVGGGGVVREGASTAQLEALCRFANGEEPECFLHPFVRAALLLGHVAGSRFFPSANGRLGRVLFTWSLLRAGYDVAGEVALSEVWQRDPEAHRRAWAQVVADGHDATPFVRHVATAWREAGRLAAERGRGDRSEVDEAARRLPQLAGCNLRQQALLVHALARPAAEFMIGVHQRSHGVTHETARADLFELEARGLLTARREGRVYRFRAVADLRARLGGAGGTGGQVRPAAARAPAGEVETADGALPVNLL